MNTSPLAVFFVCAALGAGSSPALDAAPVTTEGGLQHFQQAVDTYAQLHRRLEQAVPPLAAGSTAREIVASSDALAAALKTARVSAREGDVFSALEADAFRVLIARALYTHHYTVEEMIAASRSEAPAEAPPLAVNARFPWAYGAAMWPCMLAALPPLPEELEYRLVGHDLILVDVHANMIVDVLRNAVRPTS